MLLNVSPRSRIWSVKNLKSIQERRQAGCRVTNLVQIFTNRVGVYYISNRLRGSYRLKDLQLLLASFQSSILWAQRPHKMQALIRSDEHGPRRSHDPSATCAWGSIAQVIVLQKAERCPRKAITTMSPCQQVNGLFIRELKLKQSTNQLFSALKRGFEHQQWILFLITSNVIDVI